MINKMNRANESFVACYDERGGSWILTVPGKITRISEQIQRYATVAERLFDACEGFIRPTEIEYPILTYSTDGPIEATYPTDGDSGVYPVSVERRTVVDKHGVTAADIPFGSFDSATDGVHCIGDIESIREQSYVSLRGYEGWVDRTDTKSEGRSLF